MKARRQQSINNSFLLRIWGFTAFAVLALVGCNAGQDEAPDTPIIFGSAAYSFETREGSEGPIGSVEIEYPDGNQITLSLQGADADFLRLVNFDQIEFRVSPDFEFPEDDDRDNEYVFQIRASDGAHTATAQVSVAVINDKTDDPSSIRLKTLSIDGSSRASAYELSNKIVQTAEKVFVTYLDFQEGVHTVMLSQLSKPDLIEERELVLGYGRDNHAGAALSIDEHGDLHVFYGAHVTPMKYRYSIDGGRLEAWSEELLIDNGLTYPSVVRSGAGNLLLLARYGFNVHQPEPWSYNLYRISDGAVVDRKVLLEARAHTDDYLDRYIHYFAQIVADSSDNLHLAYILHERTIKDPTVPANGLGFGIGYMTSTDDGETWSDSEGNQMLLPAVAGNYALLAGTADVDSVVSDYRSVSIIINPNTDQPMISYIEYLLEERKWVTWLATFNGEKWESRSVAEGLYKNSLGTDKHGNIYILAEKLLNPSESVENGWANPDTRQLLLVSRDAGRTFVQNNIPLDHSGPHWYPNMKQDSQENDDLSLAIGIFMSGTDDGSSIVTLLKAEP